MDYPALLRLKYRNLSRICTMYVWHVDSDNGLLESETKNGDNGFWEKSGGVEKCLCGSEIDYNDGARGVYIYICRQIFFYDLVTEFF